MVSLYFCCYDLVKNEKGFCQRGEIGAQIQQSAVSTGEMGKTSAGCDECF